MCVVVGCLIFVGRSQQHADTIVSTGYLTGARGSRIFLIYLTTIGQWVIKKKRIF